MVDIANEAHSAELAIIISYPTRASGIIVFVFAPKIGQTKLKKIETPQKNHAYAYHIRRAWYNGS